ncbi:hypothetical protein Mgra_00006492 [Meloidogyne graminicola]|uniref:C3H1-type domain-containing protein n=1 Tax=Meloidogyne graminicola TaxID=189291 RepID=A0A8S9ZLA6_9BILA|nr:hypothetical protein Mgra_00006492 [Meloidogyne graminicola]
MIIQDENKLKTWISHFVEDISDAEPDALAKYVIALVKKPLTENVLEELCLEKLSVFLQAHTEPFVTHLFATLKSGTYLNQQDDNKVDEEKQIDYLEQKEYIKQEEDLITAETDELVLTDPDTPEQSPTHIVEQKKDIQKTTYTSSSGTVRDDRRVEKSERFSPRNSKKVHSRKESTTRTETRAPPSTTSIATISTSITTTTTATTRTFSHQQTATQPTGRPFRKRISPPRSSSAERRGGNDMERRSSPASRRKVVASAGTCGIRVSTRHHETRRETRRARSKSRERSRSPVHVSSRKEKRSVADFNLRSLRRNRCRDFHEKGFCMRGDGCPYDHGPDPVVVDDTALEKIVRASGSVFDTSSAYCVNPPPPGLETSSSSGKTLTGGGTISEGYNPEAPALTTAPMSSIDFSVPPPPLPHQIATSLSAAAQQLIYPPGTLPPPQPFSTDVAASSLLPSSFGAPIDIIRDASATITALTVSTLPVQTTSIYNQTGLADIGQNNIELGTNITGGGNLMREGRFKPYSLPANRNNSTLKSFLVKKIPQELNKIAQLDQHFSRFGQITNIQVQYEGRPDSALVTFKTRREAMAAYKSVEPILNNRFIKIFWQSDKNADENIASTDGGCYKKTFLKPLTKSTSTESNIVTASCEEEKQTEETSLEQTTKAPSNVDSNISITKTKSRTGQLKLGKRKSLDNNEVYAKLVEHQKSLLEKLKGTEDKEQRKRLIALIKKSETSSKGTKTELEKLSKQINILYIYMEQFGDLFDYEPLVFTYKDPLSAQKVFFKYFLKLINLLAVTHSTTTNPFPNANILIEWAPVSKSGNNNQLIIPDGERKPSEQVTPKDLLASLDYDEDDEQLI